MKSFLLRVALAGAGSWMVAICLQAYMKPAMWLPILTGLSLCR